MTAALGQRIKKVRQSQNISQFELAKKLKYLNQSQISKIEKGDRKVTASDVAKISKVLGVAVEDLLSK